MRNLPELLLVATTSKLCRDLVLNFAIGIIVMKRISTVVHSEYQNYCLQATFLVVQVGWGKAEIIMSNQATNLVTANWNTYSTYGIRSGIRVDVKQQ